MDGTPITITFNIMAVYSKTATVSQLQEIVGDCASTFMEVLQKHLPAVPDLMIVIPTDVISTMDGDRVSVDFQLKGTEASGDPFHLFGQEGRA